MSPLFFILAFVHGLSCLPLYISLDVLCTFALHFTIPSHFPPVSSNGAASFLKGILQGQQNVFEQL